MEPSTTKIREFLILSGPSLKVFPKKNCSKNVSYIFSKKAFLIFRKQNFSYISGKAYSEP